jgi:RND family efflux transporter MFP subunit
MRACVVLICGVTALGAVRAEPPKVDLQAGVAFLGRADANAVEIRPHVSGTLERILIKEGDAVQKGDVVAETDDRTLALGLKIAKANLDAARAEVKVAAADVARLKDAVERGIVPKGEFDAAQARREKADALAEAAKAEVELAALKLSGTKLTAPCAGRIGRYSAVPGSLLRTDGPALVYVGTLDPISISFDVDERTLLALRRAVHAGSKPVVEAGLNDEEGFPHKATLELTGVAVNPDTGTARFRAALDNPKELIVPGMTLRVRLGIQPAK